jgi:hypothetical protein
MRQGNAEVKKDDASDRYYTASDRDAEWIEKSFTYHAPKGNQQERYVKIRDEAKEFAKLLTTHCPSSPELTVALRHLGNVVMEANAAIARNE